MVWCRYVWKSYREAGALRTAIGSGLVQQGLQPVRSLPDASKDRKLEAEQRKNYCRFRFYKWLLFRMGLPAVAPWPFVRVPAFRPLVGTLLPVWELQVAVAWSARQPVAGGCLN
jgi:hypothetical protein